MAARPRRRAFCCAVAAFAIAVAGPTTEVAGLVAGLGGAKAAPLPFFWPLWIGQRRGAGRSMPGGTACVGELLSGLSVFFFELSWFYAIYPCRDNKPG